MITFNGYKRKGRPAGARNHVLLLPGTECANEIVHAIAQQVPGTTPIYHNYACTVCGEDAIRSQRSIIGLASNPNVYAAIIVGIGCEVLTVQEMTDIVNQAGGNAYYIYMGETGHFDQVVNDGIDLSKKLVAEAALQEREPCDISELTFGIRCGGSGAISAITSNASVGQAIDMFIDHGARGVFSETVEIVGAESTLAKRAATPEVAEKIYAAAQKMTDKVAAYGVDIIGAEPGIGNIKQGLSTIEEKSLGAIVKSGTRPLMDVLEYATKPTKGPGMYFMDGSAISSILYVGMSCAGAQVMLHTYGGGIDARMRSITTMPGGLKTLPVIKVMGSAVDDVAKPYFDICTDTIIRGEKSIMDMGQAIFDKAIAVASGEKPFTERECTYNEMLQFYIDGLRM